MDSPDGADLESFAVDALKNPAGQTAFNGVRLDDGQGPLGHSAII
jgi:hypothetical protein